MEVVTLGRLSQDFLIWHEKFLILFGKTTSPPEQVFPLRHRRHDRPPAQPTHAQSAAAAPAVAGGAAGGGADPEPVGGDDAGVGLVVVVVEETAAAVQVSVVPYLSQSGYWSEIVGEPILLHQAQRCPSSSFPSEMLQTAAAVMFAEISALALTFPRSSSAERRPSGGSPPRPRTPRRTTWTPPTTSTRNS